MAEKRMPAKLMVVVILLGILAALYLLAIQLLDAGIAIALIVGVLVGNDGVRTFLRAAAAIDVLWQLVVLLAFTSVATSGLVTAILVGGMAINAYFIWALGREDVRDWMFRKNFHIDEPT